MFVVVFFFKQKTAYEMRISDWSSDVCSSDLVTPALGLPMKQTMMMTYDLKGPGGVSVTASAFAGAGMLQSLRLELQQGRGFVASDYTDLDLSSLNAPTDTGATTPSILTAALAPMLFPAGGALGGHLRDAVPGASNRFVLVGYGA